MAPFFERLDRSISVILKKFYISSRNTLNQSYLWYRDKSYIWHFFLELQFLFCCLILYVNVRSIKDDEVIEMCVGALIICFKPNFVVTFLIAFPLWLDLSWRCEFFDFAFKSAVNTIKNWLFWHNHSKFNSRFSMNFSSSSWIWLGDLYKQTKSQILQPTYDLLLLHSCKIEHWKIAKSKSFFKIYKHYRVYC